MVGLLMNLCIAYFSILAMHDVQILQSSIYRAEARVMVLLLEALLVTLPSYLVLAIGLFVRTIAPSSEVFDLHA